MIRNTLLPEKVGGYYLFSKRILGFHIGTSWVTATQIYFSGKKIRIEKMYSEAIGAGPASTHNQRASNAIKTIVSQAPACDEIRTALPSSSVIFKELTLPLLSEQKIEQVLQYEVESFVPFPIENALLDFVITKQYPEEKKSSIMVTIAQKSVVAQHIDLFKRADVEPSCVSVDIIDLYSLYRQIPSYTITEKSTAILDIGLTETRIGYIQNGKLVLVRSIPKGIFFIAKEFSVKSNLEIGEAIEFILRFGLESDKNPKLTESLLKVFQKTWDSIKFTIGSFASLKKEEFAVESILMVGEGAGIKGHVEFAKNYLSTNIKLLSCSSLLKEKNFSVEKNKNIPSESITSLATTLITPVNNQFNLRQKDFTTENNNLIIRQLTMGAAIIVAIFTLFFVSTNQQINKLRFCLEKSRAEVIGTLKKEFKVPAAYKNLNDILHYSKKEVKRERDIWFAFSEDTRSSFLKHLKILSETIDRESLGLELSLLSIKKDEIVMEGNVKDFDALSKLEEDLCKSKAFRVVSPPQSPEFTINLVIAKEEEAA